VTRYQNNGAKTNVGFFGFQFYWYAVHSPRKKLIIRHADSHLMTEMRSLVNILAVEKLAHLLIECQNVGEEPVI